MNQDINVEEVLKMMCTIDGASEYLVTNSEGVPIKRSPNITPEKALHISFLINDYWATTKKIIHNDLKMGDNPIEQIRIRTSKQKELIIVQSFHGEATLYLVQKCESKKYEVPEDKKEVKAQ